MASDVAIYSYQTFGLIIRLSHNLKPKPGCYLDQKGFFCMFEVIQTKCLRLKIFNTKIRLEYNLVKKSLNNLLLEKWLKIKSIYKLPVTNFPLNILKAQNGLSWDPYIKVFETFEH